MSKISINGRPLELPGPPEMPLLWALRDGLGLMGTKFGCGMGLCGACTVHVDGEAVRSCITPLSALEGKQVTTVEGIGATTIGRRIQEAWIAADVVQCGYCQPGQIMAACALLAANKRPTEDDIDAAMSGNLCRCGTYVRIRRAITMVAAASRRDA